VPRKNGFSVVLLVAVLAALGLWLRWLSIPLPPPSVSRNIQITHDGLVKTNLATDGSNLYFTELSGDNSIISKVAATGGPVSKFPVTFPYTQLVDVSAARASLLAAEIKAGPASESPLWNYPLEGGPAHRFGDITGQGGAWSPDGQHVLVVKGSSLFVTDANGGAPQELAKVDGTPYHPRYSPDGKRIRFSVGSLELNTSTIWEVNSDGTALHAFLPNWSGVISKCCGSWTADGHYYVFQGTEKAIGSIAHLWAFSEPSGTFEKKRIEELAKLTQGSISYARPVPSPDNKKIWALGLNVRTAVVKYDPASGKYVPFLSGVSATDLDFSPDGQWVAYVSVPEGTLWRSRVDGSQAQQLTFSAGRAALPRWSPDGKQIAYIDVEEGKPWAIYIVPANGGTPQLLLAEKLTQIDVNWSSDGNTLIFGRVTQHNAEGLSIVAYDLKTHELTAIPGSEGLFSPRVSPDGHYMAAISGDLTKLMLYDIQAKKWTTWQTLDSGAVNYPVWASDSKSIYFDDLVSGEGAYSRARLGDSRAEQVFLQKGFERYLGPFGPWSGRSPDGSALFIQDVSAREVYELRVNLP
jgi:Tol biopolymer transport system component